MATRRTSPAPRTPSRSGRPPVARTRADATGEKAVPGGSPARCVARAAPAEPRAPGRPVAGPELRARLLDAAIACFTQRGIAATPLRAIAREAGVTPALVHYYFGDRAQLVEALVEERLMPAAAPLRARMELAGDDPAALIASFVRGIGDAIAASPWLPALWVREVLCDGGAL